MMMGDEMKYFFKVYGIFLRWCQCLPQLGYCWRMNNWCFTWTCRWSISGCYRYTILPRRSWFWKNFLYVSYPHARRSVLVLWFSDKDATNCRVIIGARRADRSTFMKECRQHYMLCCGECFLHVVNRRRSAFANMLTTMNNTTNKTEYNPSECL